jgi:phosphate starvation-inducible protein PhoH
MTNPQTGNRSFMSLRNVGGLVKSNSFDKNSKKIIHAMAQQMIDLSAMEGAGEFDRKAMEHKVRTSIVERGNIRSLTHDKHLPTSFYDNLKTVVQAMSYKNLGIEAEGNINDVDTKQIIDRMLADRETHMNQLTEYYTNFLEQNWKKKTPEQPLQGGTIQQQNGRKLWKPSK